MLNREQRRTVWFEPLMRKWQRDLFRQIQEKIPNPFSSDWLARSSDQFDEQGYRCEEGVRGSEHDLPACFALKVATAGLAR